MHIRTDFFFGILYKTNGSHLNVSQKLNCCKNTWYPTAAQNNKPPNQELRACLNNKVFTSLRNTTSGEVLCASRGKEFHSLGVTMKKALVLANTRLTANKEHQLS